MSLTVVGGGNPSGPTFPVQRSVRLRSSASAYFNRTQTTTTNSVKCTFSGWVKRGTLGVLQVVFGGYTGTDADTQLYFDTTNQLKFTSRITDINGAPFEWAGESAAVFRDPSAWYHIVVKVDTSTAQATNNAYYTVYVNNVAQTFTTVSGASLVSAATVQNRNTCWNVSGYSATLGRQRTNYFDGYLTEVNFIDGQALTPTSFGAYNNYGVWSPAKYTGTYGTNGFYLNFQDNSAATATTIGKDSSGNGNNWTPNNISVTAGATYDSMLDVPTLTSNTNANFSTLNPLDTVGGTFSNANLTVSVAAGGGNLAFNTMGMTSGKWYWEITPTTLAAPMIGVADANTAISTRTFNGANGWYYYNNGLKYNSGTGTAYGASYVANDVVGIALDMDAGTLTFYKNNVSQGVAYSGFTGKTMIAALNNGGSGAAQPYNANFGQRPFSYTPPSGFKSLNTYNLPAPTIPNGAAYMAATTYTGNGTTTNLVNTVNGVSFQPDLVWQKNRSSIANNILVDSVRGGNLYLISNTTGADASAPGYMTFNSNGESFTSSDVATNQSGQTYISWQWKANGTPAVVNTSGSIPSTISANTTAGFSIVTFTCPASGNFTVGHGLGVVPAMFILKTRNGVDGWYVYHKNLTTPASNYLVLNTTAATATSTGIWGNTNPTSSVLTLGTNSGIGANLNGLLYCWAEIPGFSKFGSYTGTGNSDGAFVYTGFRPRWIMTKQTGAISNWSIHDTSRAPYNLTINELYSDTADAEYTGTNDSFDLLSNGFKPRSAGTPTNASGGTYVYAAFAENPFNYSLAR